MAALKPSRPDLSFPCRGEKSLVGCHERRAFAFCKCQIEAIGDGMVQIDGKRERLHMQVFCRHQFREGTESELEGGQSVRPR